MAIAARSPWFVVLAGGDGSRLHSLTKTASGIAVPKQYCSLQGGPSLLQQTVLRAQSIVPLRRIGTVVAAQHRMWRDAQLRHLAEENIWEQPENRGTAHGVLFAVLQVLTRDPDATLVLLPADHHVREEAVFIEHLRRAAERAAVARGSVLVLAVEPDEPDTDLGYIVPDRYSPSSFSSVIEFVEKPTSPQARVLLERGALWNTFILAASARSLLSLFDGEFDSTMIRMLHAIEQTDGNAMASIYRTLPLRDFCRDILARNATRLQVLPVPRCGWTDLGTPRRVAQALERLPPSGDAAGLVSDAALGLDLASQHYRSAFAPERAARFPASAPGPEI